MKKIGTYLVYGIVSVCSIVFLITQIRFALLANNISEFDGAINLLPHYYIKHGLIPYRDFEYPYTPGLFLLIGTIIPFTSIFERNLIMIFYNLIFVTLSCVLIYKLITKHTVRLLTISFFLFLLAETNVWSTFQIQSLFILLSIFMLRQKKNSRIILAAPGILVFVLFFIRWDVALLYGLIPLFLLLVSFLTHAEKNKSLFRIATSSIIGLLTGSAVLGIYLLLHNALAQGFENIFTIPIVTIMPYRRLPLPPIGSPLKFDFLIYITLLVATVNLAVNLFAFIKTKKNNESLSQLFIGFIPFIMLPYAIGRADWLHAVPFHMLTALSLLLSAAVWSHYRKMILFFLLFIPFLQIVMPARALRTTNTTIIHADVNQAIAHCKALADKHTFNSLFVGRSLYERYVIGTHALYLVNPAIRPATRLSILDPGIQNSCYFGEIVAQDLKNAPKPMLVFLESTPQETEPNATSTMKSCGKIEKTLASMTYQRIGVCKAYGKDFELRMYK